MTDWLVKRFVKEYEETGNNVVRTRYGMLASVVGIFCNVLLFLIKNKYRVCSAKYFGYGRCI